MPLSALIFDQQFNRFRRKVSAHGDEFVSFREGVPAQWESYKEAVRQHALEHLDAKSWKPSMVGRGPILENAISAIEVDDPGARNNMVDWDLRRGPNARVHRALVGARDDPAARRELELWLFNFFTGRSNDESAFEEFCELAGRGYGLVAYLFFLKDWSRFAPIRPTVFDEALELLGVAVQTTRRCSWANYREYNAALLEVEDALKNVAGVRDARLIDAHSFCWMLVRLPGKVELPAVRIPLPTGVGQLKPAALTKRAPPNDDEPFPMVTDEEFAQRDAVQRRVGRLAQDIALRSERLRLDKGGRSDLAERVEPVWNQPMRGYDIRSFELDGAPRHIEVKAVSRSGRQWSFYVSANEWSRSRDLENYYFYLVTAADSRRPAVHVARAEDVPEASLIPQSYKALLQLA